MCSQLHMLVLGCALVVNSVASCDYPIDVCGAFASGDVILGGLYPCHSTVGNIGNRTQPDNFQCSEFGVRAFVRMLAMIHTIETINESNLLPGIKLGYMICDTCADATKAIQSTELLLSKNGSREVKCSYTRSVPTVKAVIGAQYSEVSIAVAKLFNLYLIPQISPTSSASILSDKVRYPSFLRTIPSDVHQTKALAELVARFKWNWVGVIANDDDYGKSAVQSFVANTEQLGICIAFQELIPAYIGLGDIVNKIKNVADKIQNSSANVIVAFLKSELVIKLFTELLERNVSKTWIASDSWSGARDVASMHNIDKVGNIFGVSFKLGHVQGFEEYLKNLRPGPTATNKFIEEYKRLRFECTEEFVNYTKCVSASSAIACNLTESLKLKSPMACNYTDPSSANDDFLVENIDVTYSSHIAVRVVAHALRNLLKCNDTACERHVDFPPWQLLKEIKEVNFSQDDGPFYFDKNGDSANGYDFIYWVTANGHSKFEVVGKYKLNEPGVEVDESLITEVIPESKCSESCKPGTIKKVSNISCCYSCIDCSEGTYSDKWDMADCLSCSGKTWSLKGATQCRNKTEMYLHWDEGYAIVLVTFGSLGIVLLFIIAVIYTVNLKTPAVKAAGGNLCYLIVGSLMLSFCSIGLFIGKPNQYTCQIRQPLYGISFTICVSCILVKSFRTILAFKRYSQVQAKLKKIYKPLLIILFCAVMQGVICTMWLIFDSPQVDERSTNQTMEVLIQCSEGSNVGFGIMLSYIGLLAFICFVLAFKGRKVPHAYNETGYIIFSMLVYLFVWVCFIPIYVNKSEQRSAVQASAILASDYGIICCHLIPKCYIMLFKKEANNEQRYMDKLRQSMGSVFSVESAMATAQILLGDGQRCNDTLRKRRGSW
ncbi:G-protein coupled receptor family C group 6 member A [Acipenser oxyrinchus oxyrinchus]|uniref:G-protein coupled receptor family C group 6 member A n=1 Tax=Acipenser oxyrinchus oxyrinchus TaxID=40147 RepID=A0AAD8LP12_ACIOX|nr:G-protein coupled receptor family C group 6 member A [Acipenser oxyrinchus oxyrinchus]